MKIHAARLFVTDMDAARVFYGETLGWPLAFDGGNAVGYDLGILVIIEPAGADDPDLTGRFTGLSIDCPDIDATYDRLRQRGVSFTGPPHKQEWGGVLAHFNDPSGNTISLVSGAPA